MTEPESEATEVRGERGSSTLAHAPSMQSRVSNILAIGLMSVLGLGMLTWYYANAMSRPSHARQSAQALSAKRAQGEMPLPSLGRIDPPVVERTALPKDPAPRPATESIPLREVPLREIPLAATPVPAAYGAPPAKTPAELAVERQLSGAVFSAQSSPPIAAVGSIPPSAISAPQETGELGGLLRPSVTAAVHAQVLPTQRLLLPKGAFLDCTLETAIDSTLPGMTTCVMATDTFGVDGAVVLLERGTKLVGETRGQVQQGSARVFVLWNEARTPSGVIVPLASPGADELGRAGLPGTVDRHFWERFGAAMLVSVIDGAIQTAVQSSRSSSGTLIVNPSATQDVMTEVLKGTINIPPTVLKQQGDRIQVLVARDLDFRSVYELKSTASLH
ncbi:MAG TPA: type IV secretion system protein VirB10 [Steroidobacteraceae bacterium]|jgi:type IV secretion system protein VirB10|nr:type IV secretion system protein VirB10 [Steroidobacteraceae bacterium]